MVWMGASLWIRTFVRLLVEALEHEVGHLFVREIVYHFNLNLLKDKISLFLAFLLGLLLEAHL